MNSESTRSLSPVHLVKLHAMRPTTGLFQEQLHGKTSYPCGHPHCSGQSEDKKFTAGIWSLDSTVLDSHHWEVHWWNSCNPHKTESPSCEVCLSCSSISDTAPAYTHCITVLPGGDSHGGTHSELKDFLHPFNAYSLILSLSSHKPSCHLVPVAGSRSRLRRPQSIPWAHEFVLQPYQMGRHAEISRSTVLERYMNKFLYQQKD